MHDASVIRVSLQDRPGGLALVSGRLADYGVDILRLEVVERREGVAVDDLLVCGGDLDAALASLAAEVEVVAFRERADLPDPGLTMAAACESVTTARGVGDVRRRLLNAALELVLADAGVVLRDAGHGWLRPVASSVAKLPPIDPCDPAVAREVVETGEAVTGSGLDEWAPGAYRDALPHGSLLVVAGGSPPYFALAVLRRQAAPFVESEIERLRALVRVTGGVLAAHGDSAVEAPLAVHRQPRVDQER